MKKFFNLFLLGIFLLLCFTGCEIDGQPPIDPAELTPAPTEPGDNPFDAYIRNTKYPLQMAYNGDVRNYSQHTTDTNCTIEDFEIVRGIIDFPCLNPSSSAIWPGALLEGQSVVDGSFKPITTERAPVTISCSIQNTGQSVTETIEKPTLSKFRDALNSIVWSNKDGDVPALIESDTIRVYSYEHMLTELGISVKASYNGLFQASGSLESLFDWESTEQRTKIMMKFTQVYFSCDMDIPYKPSDFFTDETYLENYGSQIASNGITPCYVSSVNYGRVAMVAIQSSESESQVRSAFKTSFNASYLDFSGGASFSLSDEEKRIISESKVSVYILGGNVASAVNVAADPSKWTDYLTALKNTTVNTPVVPLSYQVNYMKDNTWMTLVLGTKGQVRLCGEVQIPTDVPTPEPQIKTYTKSWNYPDTYTWISPANLADQTIIIEATGGGGGGGGSYTSTGSSGTSYGEGGRCGKYQAPQQIKIKANTKYSIIIGKGGEGGESGFSSQGGSQPPTSGENGGATKFFLTTDDIIFEVNGGIGGRAGSSYAHFSPTGETSSNYYKFGDGGDQNTAGFCGQLIITYQVYE